MPRSRTIRRAQERRGAISRDWLQQIDRDALAAVDAVASVVVVHPTNKDRVRGVTADFVEDDGPLIPWGHANKSDPTLLRFAWAASRRLPPVPSRGVVLSFIGAQ